MNRIKSSIQERINFLSSKSSYKSEYDWPVFYDFHKKYSQEISDTNGIQLINNFIGCENCHVGFQIDTYLEGCTHNCKYCYAKLEGEEKNKWNSPVPKPLDFTHLWKELYLTFEDDSKDHSLFKFLSKKIPIRIGSLSDPFIPLEKQLGITKELLKILNHYDYPYLIVTRSNLISKTPYISILKPSLASIHISIPSLNEEMTRTLEPGAPSPQKRLDCIRELVDHEIWVTARVNPLFPTVKDGDLVPGEMDKIKKNKLEFYSDDLIRELAKTGCKSVLVGFVTLKSDLLDTLSKDLNFNLRSLMKDTTPGIDFKFSSNEIRKYFEHIRGVAKSHNLEFTTCYLGQNKSQYTSNQDLWDNKKDCCNSIDKVNGHKDSSTIIPRHDSLKLMLQNKNWVHRIALRLLAFILERLR